MHVCGKLALLTREFYTSNKKEKARKKMSTHSPQFILSVKSAARRSRTSFFAVHTVEFLSNSKHFCNMPEGEQA